LITLCRRLSINPTSSQLPDPVPLLKSFLIGFAAQTALRLPDGSYRSTVGGQTVFIHPSSVLFGKGAECVVFDELVRWGLYFFIFIILDFNFLFF